MTRVRLLGFFLIGALAATAPSGVARADDVAEASALFESGNGHFETGMRQRGGRRTRELEAALDDYFASLRLVRSRNVLYNTALVLEQLERWDDAFNYWTEYLAVPGLSADELADGNTHRDAVRPRVSVARIESTPSGAEVWVDRRDLSSRGRTPLEIAVPAGEHQLFLSSAGWDETEGRVTTVLGTTVSVSVALTARPVMVQVLAPEARILLDGVEIRAGSSLAVPPGEHLLALELEGHPTIERRFEVVPGGAPMVIDLTTAVAALVDRGTGGATATLSVEATSSSRILVDGLVSGSGTRVDVPVAAGDHEITVEPSGGSTFRGRRVFVAGERVALRLSMRPTSDGLVVTRGLFGTLAALGLFAAGGLSIGSFVALDGYESNPSPTSFASVETINLAADISWGATAALGIVAMIAVIADDAGTDGGFVDAEAAEGSE